MGKLNGMISYLLILVIASCQASHHLRLPDYMEDEDVSSRSQRLLAQEEKEREEHLNIKIREAKIQEYLARLREIRFRELQQRQEALEASAGADIAPVVIPPPRHRPQKLSKPAYPPDSPYISSYYSRLHLKPEFTFSPNKQQIKSDFAVPPTDNRFSEAPSPTEGKPQIHLEDVSDFVTSTEIQLDDVIRTPVSIYDGDAREFIMLVGTIAGCVLFVVLMLSFLSVSVYKFQKNVKAAAVVDYPAYGVTGPNRSESTPTGDRKLAQSAQMYHYQITKQQILCMENNQGGAESEADSEEENEQDYTVYECPGLAPTGEMEVKNPLFIDDPTPVLPPTEQPPDKK